MFNIGKKKKDRTLEYLKTGKDLKNIRLIAEQINEKVPIIEYGYKDHTIYINNEEAASYVIVNSTAKLERLADSTGKGLNGIMFDIGANCGVFSYFYQTLHPKSKIYLFEPNQAMTPIINKNLSLGSNYEIIQEAVSSEKGEIEFFSNPGSNQSNSTEYEALLPFVKSENIVRSKVSSLTLEDFCIERQIDEIETLKIDIQGGEYKALSASRKVLSFTKIALVEVCFLMPDTIPLLKLIDDYFPNYEPLNEIIMGADLKFFKN